MHKNLSWLAFLAVIALIVVWFSAATTYDLYSYYIVNTQTFPTKVEWSIKGKSSDRYILSAKYQYRIKNTLFEGETAFHAMTYKSPRAAEIKLAEHKKQEWAVWYSARNPENSTLLKLFPYKSCAYAVILWGLLLYFVWLGFYVGKAPRLQKD
jgi:hypothetical protein